MAKYDEWLEPEGLIKIEGWSKDGLTDEQIAHNMGISRSTLNEWKKKFSDISDTLKKGKEVSDRMVENALYKRAIGYHTVEKKYAPVELTQEEYELHQYNAVKQYREQNPDASPNEIKAVELQVPRFRVALVEEKVKEVLPDTTAQIFWLKNRKPAEWRDKQEVNQTGELTVNFPIPRPTYKKQ